MNILPNTGGGGGGGGSVAWSDVTGKPSTFPPSAHTQAISSITGLQTALDDKQPVAAVLTNTTASFTTAQESKLAGIATGATANSTDAQLRDRSTHTGTQAISTVSGLQTALDGKAASVHTHPAAQISDATPAGRTLLTADNAAAQRLALRTMAPHEGFFWREEFRNGGVGLVLFSSFNAGNGSANNTVAPTAGSNRDGIVSLRTGTGSSADQRGGYFGNATTTLLGDGNRYYYGMGVRPNTAFFDATLTGYHQFGLCNTAQFIGAAFVGFLAENGGNWRCVVRNNSVETSFDLGLPSGSAGNNVWLDGAFVYYEGGSRVDFYVNGSLTVSFHSAAGTNNATNIYSAQIPTNALAVGLKAVAQRVSATPTDVRCDLDYIDFGCRYSAGMAARNTAALALL